MGVIRKVVLKLPEMLRGAGAAQGGTGWRVEGRSALGGVWGHG